MDTAYTKFSKLSLPIPEDWYQVLEQKAISVNTSVSDFLTLFVADIVSDDFSLRPVRSLAHGWYQDCVPKRKKPSFIQWLAASYRLHLFFCLLDSLYFHMEQFTEGKGPGRDLSLDELCVSNIDDLMVEAYCGGPKLGPEPPEVTLKSFPIDVQTHIDHIFKSIHDLYIDYMECLNIEEEDEMFLVDIFLAFDLWKERKLRY